MDEPVPETHHPRRSFQFRLRTLLLLMVVLAIPCAWLAHRRHQNVRQQEAIEAIIARQGIVDFVTPSRTTGAETGWWQKISAEFSLRPANSVWLAGSKAQDADLKHIEALSELKILSLGQTQITDAGLKHLEGLSELVDLEISRTQITDAGLEHLQGMLQLRNLNLVATKITDAGLEHLTALTQLRVLHLHNTQVTAVGIERLQESLPGCRIDHD